MSHLGERVSTLVDGQLGVDAAERALMHIASCPECRDAVEIERLTKQRLATLGGPPPGGDLLHRLMGLAGPSGPLPPRSGHVPGSLTTTSAGFGGGGGLGGVGLMTVNDVGRGLITRPPGRRGSSRPPLARSVTLGRMVRVSQSSRNRMAAAMVGAACLVGAGVAGGIANSGVSAQRVVPPVDSFVVEHSATTAELPFADQTVVWGVVGAGR
jgi:hypothetical protein